MTGAEKFRKVLHEFKNKELHNGSSGDLVTDRKQALAIAYSEARQVDPNYGKYEGGGELYESGGEIMNKYKADDYYPMGDGLEFMFGNRAAADKMANDYNSEVIEESESYFVPVAKNKMASGGEIESMEEKLCNACDDNDRIHENEFKKITGNHNPSRFTEHVGDIQFDKCLFSPHYRFMTDVGDIEDIEELGLGGTIKRTARYAKLTNIRSLSLPNGFNDVDEYLCKSDSCSIFDRLS